MIPRPQRIRHDDEVSVVDHLDELRQRLFVCIFTLGAAFVVAFLFHTNIMLALQHKLPPHVPKPSTFGVGEPFKLAMSVSFWAGLVIASPVLIYQLYAYVIPAFEPKHQKGSRWFLLLVPSLFLAGVAFCYAVVLSPALSFLLNFDMNLYNTQVRAGEFYSWCTTMMLAMGLIFEMPAVIMLLARIGIVTSRMLRKNWRYALVLTAVLAAALPGADPVSMILEWLPLIGLYIISIFLAKLVEPKRGEAPIADVAPEA